MRTRIAYRWSGATLLQVGIILLVISSVAAPAATAVAPAAATVMTDADNGKTVQLKTGDVLELHLTSNPSTGYSWSVMPQSTPLLKLIRESKTQATQPGLGRPIQQIFKFQATGAGSGVLLLHYVRSWEKPQPTDKQFSLHVTIE